MINDFHRVPSAPKTCPCFLLIKFSGRATPWPRVPHPSRGPVKRLKIPRVIDSFGVNQNSFRIFTPFYPRDNPPNACIFGVFPCHSHLLFMLFGRMKTLQMPARRELNILKLLSFSKFIIRHFEFWWFYVVPGGGGTGKASLVDTAEQQQRERERMDWFDRKSRWCVGHSESKFLHNQ